MYTYIHQSNYSLRSSSIYEEMTIRVDFHFDIYREKVVQESENKNKITATNE
jgi:hypothetical protein